MSGYLPCGDLALVFLSYVLRSGRHDVIYHLLVRDDECDIGCEIAQCAAVQTELLLEVGDQRLHQRDFSGECPDLVLEDVRRCLSALVAGPGEHVESSSAVDARLRHPVGFLANRFDHVVGQDAEVIVADLGELRFLCIAFPVEAHNVPHHLAFAQHLVGLVLLGVPEHPLLRPRIVGIVVRVQSGKVVVEDLRGVVVAGRIPLVEPYPLVGG